MGCRKIYRERDRVWVGVVLRFKQQMMGCISTTHTYINTHRLKLYFIPCSFIEITDN